MEIKTRQIDENLLNRLKQETKLDDISLRLLINRGYDNKDKIDNFMNFSASDLRDINTMKDINPFMDTLISSIKNKEEITIYGDYDSDGIMATYIFVSALRRLNIKTNYFINNRFKEGYGMCIAGVDRLLEKFPDTRLIITCDNGIAAKEGVEYCTAKNIKVIISDHHQEQEDIKINKNITPVVCESRLDEDESLKESFTGAELARRIISELYSRLGIKNNHINYLKSLCAYSGFSIISDSVPMTPANHYISKMGIKAMNMFKTFPLWNALQTNNNNPIDENTIAFSFAPMFNAVSRLSGECDICVELLLSEDKKIQYKILQQMQELNNKRKELTQEHFSKISSSLENSRAYVLETSAPEGLIGILAGKLVEKYNKPAIVFTPLEDNPKILKGSARSPEDIDLYSLLLKNNYLFENFGGHKLACGVSIKRENLHLLKQFLEDALKNRKPIDNVKYVDFELVPKDIIYDFIENLRTIAPYGSDFFAPEIALEIKPEKISILKSLHYKMLQDNLNIMHFSSADDKNIVYKENEYAKVVGYPCINIFMGNKSRQFIIKS